MDRWIGTRAGWVVAFAVAMVTSLAVGALGGASGAGIAGTISTASGSTSTLWAYGAEENVTLSVTSNHTTYSVAGWFAYHVILTQTNTSTSTFQLELNRTMGFAYTALYCSPACGGAAKVSVNISVKAWEHDVGFANFTRAGSVTSNGTAVPALALVNSSAASAANLSERVSYSSTLPLHPMSGQQELFVALTSSAAVNFTPPLGLVPLNLTAGESWNSTSTYAALGQAHGVVNYYRTVANGTTMHSGITYSPSVSGSGTVYVHGRDLGTIVLHGGRSVPVLAIGVIGPFEPREGLIWVPASVDLFGAGSGAFSADSAGSVSAATETVDWAADLHGHVGLYASAVHFGPAPDATNQMGGDPAMMSVSTAAAVAPSVAPAVSPSAADIQGQPETVAQAQSGSQCIQSSSCGSTVPPGGPTSGLGRLAGGLIVLGVVVTLAALVVGLIVSRRRVPPPPAMPQYPPRGATIGVPPRRPETDETEPEEEPDSLGHLW